MATTSCRRFGTTQMKRFKHIVRRVCATYVGAFFAAPLLVLVCLVITMIVLIEEPLKGVLSGYRNGVRDALYELRGGLEVVKKVGNPFYLRSLALKALSDEKEKSK